MPVINGRVSPAKIYYENSWVFIAEKIYQAGIWWWVHYYAVAISMDVEDKVYLGDAAAAMITVDAILIV